MYELKVDWSSMDNREVFSVSSVKSDLNVRSGLLASIEVVSIVELEETISPILTSRNKSCL